MSYNGFYCSKFSDKYSVLHQARSGNEKILDGVYSTGRGKTGKTDAPIENELDIVRN